VKKEKKKKRILIDQTAEVTQSIKALCVIRNQEEWRGGSRRRIKTQKYSDGKGSRSEKVMILRGAIASAPKGARKSYYKKGKGKELGRARGDTLFQEWYGSPNLKGGAVGL